MMYLTVASALLALTSFVSAQVTDLQSASGTAVNRIWLEAGFVYIDDRSWTPIVSSSKEWAKPTSVFISLPDIGGNLYNSPTNKFLAPRVKSKVTNGDNSRSFLVKLQQANDSACSKQWYVPQFLSTKVQISWMIVEQGVYSLGSRMFIIGEGNMTRANADATATIANGNAIRIWYPENCLGVAGSCEHPGTDAARGAVTQLQTDNNKINGREFFLYVRIKVVFSRHIQLVLIPHSSATSSIFTITTKEIVAYMIFETPVNMKCLEKMVFETNVYSAVVSSTAINVNYANTYLYPPGLFGGLSTVSLTDATVLRQFNNGINSGNFITQEDQCFDEQTIHTTAETAFTIVVGEIAGVNTLTCKVKFEGVETFAPTFAPTNKPTTANPTAAPTFAPTQKPTLNPTQKPTLNPTANPTLNPTLAPTLNPTTAAPTGVCSDAELEVTFRKTARR
jgi:hypothetical protein